MPVSPLAVKLQLQHHRIGIMWQWIEPIASELVGDDGKGTGNFGLVKVAMNHAGAMTDVTQGYIMLQPRLAMLRHVYIAHERKVFEAAGLSALLPKEKGDGISEIVEALKGKAGDAKALAKIKKALGIA
jgi:hypothetical protein